MKKVLLASLVVFLFLAGCRGKATPAPVGELPTGAVTPSPTVTFTPNPTESYQGTLRANQTQNAGMALTQGVRLAEGAQTQAVKQTEIAQTQVARALTPTNTPTITPTYTPYPTETPLPTFTPRPTVILPIALGSEYKLVTPDQDALISLIMKTIYEKADESFAQTLDYEWERNLATFDTAIFNLGSLPQENGEKEFYIWNWPFRPNSFYDFLAVITANFINQEAIQLANTQAIQGEGFEAQPYQIEIDGDNEPEWLIYSEYEEIASRVWITLDQIGQGQFRLLNSNIQGDGGFPTLFYELSQLEDFTGDGLTDVVLAHGTYFGGGADSIGFQFLQGTPQGFKLVYHVWDGNNSPYDETTYDWILNDETVPVLRIMNDNFKDWCRETTYREFKWQPDGVQELSVPNLPESADCAIARALFGSPDNATTIYWLETALKMEALRPQLSLEDLVYVHYRLALAYAVEGDDAVVRQHLKFITDLAVSNEVPVAISLASQIKPLLSESEIYPILLCRAAQEIALPIIEAGIYTFLYPYEGISKGYPTPLCEMMRYQEDALNQLVPRPSGNISVDLEAAGFSVVKLQSVSLGKSTPGWLAILAEHNTPIDFEGQLTNLDRQMAYVFAEGLGWHSFGRFFPDKPLEQLNADVTDDGSAELAFAQPDENNCDENQTGYDLSLISSIGNGWVVSVDEQLLCVPMMETFDWNVVLQDQNEDGLVDWLVEDFFADYDLGLLENNAPPQPIVFDWWDEIRPLTYKTDLLTALDEKFFASPTPSLLRPDLEFYRARWGTGDDPTSEQIYAHLTYLLALTYELDGNAPRAVELFYDIWANHPDTLWAYLAAARLELKNE